MGYTRSGRTQDYTGSPRPMSWAIPGHEDLRYTFGSRMHVWRTNPDGTTTLVGTVTTKGIACGRLVQLGRWQSWVDYQHLPPEEQPRRVRVYGDQWAAVEALLALEAEAAGK